MPWKEINAMEQRVKFVVESLESGRPFSEICRDYGISRRTGYRWVERYEEVGSVLKLSERSRRPHTIPKKTATNIEERVVALRKRYGWAGKKLQVLLQREGIHLAVITIDRIIKRNGLVTQPSCVRTTKRFEREKPNELWQMDFKGPFEDAEVNFIPLTILDDHSRFVLGLHTLQRMTGEVVQKHVISTFRRYGMPEAMLMDHGTPWWATKGDVGLTSFSVELIRRGLKLYYSGVGHPQTQGKVERFHQTLKKAVRRRRQPRTILGWKSLFKRFCDEYNFVRPHEGIGLSVPAARYERSTREYQEQTRPWEYPTGSAVTKVNSAGNINYRGNQFFISHALKGDYVRLEQFEEVMLVSYRNMYVREIEPSTGRTTAVVLPVDA